MADRQGVYYDTAHPNDLETLLGSDQDLLSQSGGFAHNSKQELIEKKLSKYNNFPEFDFERRLVDTRKRILVVDQTRNDLSILLGGADGTSFTNMIATARSENPEALVLVKRHPEVVSGRKQGYLSWVEEDDETMVVDKLLNPIELIRHVDKVYVVTSQIGFEALLLGKPVVCFGTPWYAGWGVTDDRIPCRDRGRGRSVDELFAAMYFHYARYLNPFTHRRGTILDVMEFLGVQRAVARSYATGRSICVGFPRWRAETVLPLLSSCSDEVRFVRNARMAARLAPSPSDRIIWWGCAAPTELEDLSARTGAGLCRMEDGFFRSVGLGSDYIPPQSVVLDTRGLYVDPRRPSDLEHILNTATFSAQDLDRAATVRAYIVAHGLTKYNLERPTTVDWDCQDKPVVLTIGQVEDDASIRFGCEDVRSNVDLLAAVRQDHPDAFVVYKPHPDVMSGNRKGRLDAAALHGLVDHVETRLGIVECIERCDVVHTMTSFSGFDALLHGKRVVVHGRPFYAGWGLTEDRLVIPRRERTLSLDQLVAGTLIRYPIYWDPVLKAFTTVEAALRHLKERRDALATSGDLDKLRSGWFRRRLRKLRVAKSYVRPRRFWGR